MLCVIIEYEMYNLQFGLRVKLQHSACIDIIDCIDARVDIVNCIDACVDIVDCIDACVDIIDCIDAFVLI